MSSVLEFAPSLSHVSLVSAGRVLETVEGGQVLVQLEETTRFVECQVLHTGSPSLALSDGDAVLVWLHDGSRRGGIVLGRIGPYTEPTQIVVAPDTFGARPETLVLEAQGDIVLRNGEAKITLSAAGDVEIVCKSFTTRSQRLLRLLASMIKLN
jgi:hypothetical protein